LNAIGCQLWAPILVDRGGIDLGPTGGVEAGQPVDEDERLPRDELAGLPVEHIEDPVLRGLHDHFAWLAVDR